MAKSVMGGAEDCQMAPHCPCPQQKGIAAECPGEGKKYACAESIYAACRAIGLIHSLCLKSARALPAIEFTMSAIITLLSNADPALQDPPSIVKREATPTSL